MSTTRGVRLLKALSDYSKNFQKWDTTQVLQKTEIHSANNGQLTGSFTVTEDMCNCLNALHGGFISSLIDAYSLFAYFSHPHGRISWTTSMHIQYIAPAILGDKIKVETKPLHLTHRSTILDSLLTDEATGKLIARGTVKMQIATKEHQELVAKVIPFNANDPN